MTTLGRTDRLDNTTIARDGPILKKKKEKKKKNNTEYLLKYNRLKRWQDVSPIRTGSYTFQQYHLWELTCSDMLLTAGEHREHLIEL